MSYIVLPSGAAFASLEDALDCAKLDSATGPDYRSHVENADDGELVARFRKGERL